MFNTKTLLGLLLACVACEGKHHGADHGHAHDGPEGHHHGAVKRAPVTFEVSRERCLDVAALADTARELRARVDKTPELAAAWVALGHAWVQAARRDAKPERYRNAQACAEVALVKSPNDASALGLLALAYQDDHRFEDVRQLARRILARDPDDPFAYGLLSDAELELGDRAAAIAAAQRMVDLKPSLASYGRAAHLRFLQGDTAGAKRLYQLAIFAGKHERDREPRAWMIVQAALVFLAEKDYAGAEAGLALALRDLPGYAPALRAMERVTTARREARREAKEGTRARAVAGL